MVPAVGLIWMNLILKIPNFDKILQQRAASIGRDDKGKLLNILLYSRNPMHFAQYSMFIFQNVKIDIVYLIYAHRYSSIYPTIVLVSATGEEKNYGGEELQLKVLSFTPESLTYQAHSYN